MYPFRYSYHGYGQLCYSWVIYVADWWPALHYLGMKQVPGCTLMVH